MSILLLAHVDTDGSLAKPALEALGAAKELAAGLSVPFDVGLVGGTADAAAVQIGSCGAAQVFGVCAPELTEARYGTDAAAAEAVARVSGADIILVPGTSRWMRVVAGVAQRLGGRVDTHVTECAAAGAEVSVTRWYYKQRIEGVLTRQERPLVLAIEPGTRAPWAGAPSAMAVTPVDVVVPAGRTRVVGVRAPASGEATVRPDAELLLVAGAGWTKKQADGAPHVADAERLILAFLAGARASLGGSKSLVDQSGDGQAVLPFMTHVNQVGQTGASPRHRKGLATCCHGEEPHVVGWRFIGERRAVNLNPNCGWAQGKADVLYVADAFEVMAKVNELLG